MILATKSSTPIIGQLATVMGMDHGWYLQIAEYLWNSEYRSLYCHLQYPYLCSYDPTADQTAEIL